MSLDETHYDVAILSTGLPQSILSAALSVAGLSVIHLDANDHYADQWASLTLQELRQWSDRQQSGKRNRQHDFQLPAHGEGKRDAAELSVWDRHYSLSLAPTLIPATGLSIDTLISSKVSSYATFRLLEHIAVYDGQKNLSRVPSSKEDVFKTKRLSLIAKRKLMKLLLHIASDEWDQEFTEHPERAEMPFAKYLEEVQKLPADLRDAVAYGVSLCSSAEDTTKPALERARLHLKSIGRYGNSAYLVGQYGGAGELAQGYCRASAVKGGMFILDHQITSLEEKDGSTWQLEIENIEQKVTADFLVSSDEQLEQLAPNSDGEWLPMDIVRGVVVLQSPIDFEAETKESADEVEEPSTPETGLLVFPPGSLEGNESTITVLMMGEGTFSCPKGQYVYYLQTQSSRTSEKTATQLLRPAMDVLLGHLASKDQPCTPILIYFYRQSRRSAPKKSSVLVVPFMPTTSMTALTDHAVQQAEEIYYNIMAARHNTDAQCLRDKVEERKRRRRRDPSEFAGRGGRGEDDGVTQGSEDIEIPGFFEKNENQADDDE